MIIAVVLSLFIGAISTWGIMKIKNDTAIQEARKQESEACSALVCGGQELGNVRINMVNCNGENEICICSDPNILQHGLGL